MAATPEVFGLTAAGWAAIATGVAAAALGLNAWSSISSKKAAESAAETARLSVQLQAASLPVEFGATLLGAFSWEEPMAVDAPIFVENLATAPVYVHNVRVESLTCVREGDLAFNAHPFGAFSESPPRLLHKGDTVSFRAPVGFTWQKDDRVEGTVEVTYSHAADGKPLTITRPIGTRTWMFGAPELGPLADL